MEINIADICKVLIKLGFDTKDNGMPYAYNLECLKKYTHTFKGMEITKIAQTCDQNELDTYVGGAYYYLVQYINTIKMLSLEIDSIAILKEIKRRFEKDILMKYDGTLSCILLHTPLSQRVWSYGDVAKIEGKEIRIGGSWFDYDINRYSVIFLNRDKDVVTTEQVKIMHHAIGTEVGEFKEDDKYYRNHYAVNSDTKDETQVLCANLVYLGYMQLIDLSDSMHYYSVTEAGLDYLKTLKSVYDEK